MSNWVSIIADIRRELALGDHGNIPESAWPVIARHCGPAEIADIRTRLSDLQTAKNQNLDWDGDAADDIWHAERLFNGVLAAVCSDSN